MTPAVVTGARVSDRREEADSGAQPPRLRAPRRAGRVGKFMVCIHFLAPKPCAPGGWGPANPRRRAGGLTPRDHLWCPRVFRFCPAVVINLPGRMPLKTKVPARGRARCQVPAPPGTFRKPVLWGRVGSPLLGERLGIARGATGWNSEPCDWLCDLNTGRSHSRVSGPRPSCCGGVKI